LTTTDTADAFFIADLTGGEPNIQTFPVPAFPRHRSPTHPNQARSGRWR